MDMKTNDVQFASSLEENMKKALTELVILKLLSGHEYYISELTGELKRTSGGRLNIVFPYGAVYRLCRGGYITEGDKRNAPDGRLRQYYKITDQGRLYLEQLIRTYEAFTRGIQAVLSATEG